MTSEELNRRIEKLMIGSGFGNWDIGVKQLISDVVEELLPEPKHEEVVSGIIRIRGQDVGFNSALGAIRTNKAKLGL